MFRPFGPVADPERHESLVQLYRAYEHAMGAIRRLLSSPEPTPYGYIEKASGE